MMLQFQMRRISTLRRWALVGAALLFVNVNGLPASADEVEGLAKFLPSDANAIAVVRVEEVMNTQRAIQEDWAKHADEQFLSGTGGIPSWVNTLVVGYQLRLGARQEIWAAGIASVPRAVSVSSIAQKDGATPETLNNLAAVRTRRNSYAIDVAEGILGVWQPGIRQEAARWTRALQAKSTGALPEYLLKAAATPGQVIMAIDLDHVLDPTNTQAYLESMPEIGGQTARDKTLAQLMTLKGATFSAVIKDKTTATLRVDFTSSVAGNSDNLQLFLRHMLNDLGAAIDDFDSGKFATEGNSLILTTEMSDISMRRIVSLISTPPSSDQSDNTTQSSPTAPPATAETPDRSTTQRQASQQYFRQVDQYINDLSKANRRATEYSRTAQWHENFASKIDELSIDNVDPALVDYGHSVSSKLRGLARSLRGQQLNVNLQQGTLVYDQEFNPGWASVSIWGGVGYGQGSVNVTSNLQQVRERQAAAISEGAQQREDIWAMLTEERQKVLRDMQQKYGTDFSATRSR